MPVRPKLPNGGYSEAIAGTDLRVDSFHINIGAGDSAIHILSSGAPSSKLKRIVQRAVFIDGGKTDDGAVKDEVLQTIHHIESTFKCYKDDNYGNLLVFDGIVVTHWDGDHYRGIMAFLLKDVEERFDPKDKNPVAFELQRAWYQGRDGDMKRENIPESWFFAPNFDKNPKIKRNYDQRFWLGNDKSYLGMRWRHEKDKTEYKDLPKLLRCAYTTEDILGRDLFHPRVEVDIDTEEVKDIDKLLEEVPPRIPNELKIRGEKPALYCIAVNNTILGSAANALTETNKSSICLMIIWSSGHCSHYFSGDAERALEMEIAEWVNHSVTSMKLSHHGSMGSTPPSLLQTFEPTNIFISAGSMYGHPRWEIMSYIQAMMPLFARKGAKTPRPPLFLSTYPYYLIQDGNGEYNTTISMSTDQLKMESILREAIEEIEDDVRKLLKGRQKKSADLFTKSVTEWEKEKNQSASAVKERIFTFVDLIFPTICNQFESRQATSKAKTFITSSNQTSTVYVAITSTEDEKTDGSVICGYNNGKTEKNAALYWDVFKSVAASGNGYRIMPKVARRVTAEILDKSVALNLFPKRPKDHGAFRDFTMKSRPIASREARPELDSSGRPRQDSWCHVNPYDSSDDDWNLHEDDFDDIASCTSGSRRTSSSMEMIHMSEALHLADQPAIVFVKSAALDVALDWDTPPLLVKKDHPLFEFVEALHWRLFVLESQGSPEKPLEFARDDRWNEWFQAFFSWNEDTPGSVIRPKTFSMKMKSTTWLLDAQSTADFSVSFPFPTGGNGEAPRTLTFDTEHAPRVFESVLKKTGKDGKVEVEPVAALRSMLVNRVTMAFGLTLSATDPPFKTTIGAVAKLIGMSQKGSPVFSAIGHIGLTLDTRPDARNALWFRPTSQQETKFRMQFTVDAKDELMKWLGKAFKSFTILDMLVIARKSAQYLALTGDDTACGSGELTFLLQCSISNGLSFDGAVTLGEETVELSLTTPSSFKQQTTADGLTGIIDWIAENLNLNGDEEKKKTLPLKSWLDNAGKSVDQSSIKPRCVEFVLDLNEDGSIEGINSASIAFEITIDIGKPSDPKVAADSAPIVVLLVFGWGKETGVFLKGSLWAADPPSPFDVYAKALPEWERYADLEPITPVNSKSPLRTLDIKNLMSDETIDNLPRGIPTEIVHASLELNATGISMRGSIRCSDAPEIGDDGSGPPTLVLDNLDVSVRYNWSSEKGKKGLKLSLGVDVLLFRDQDSLDTDEDPVVGAITLPPARLMGSVDYDHAAKSWQLRAGVTDLTVAHLAQFWVKDQRSDVMKFLGKIKADYIEVVYDTKPGQSSFEVTGVLSLGSTLKLGLKYNNDGPKSWCFSASLALAEKQSPWTVGDVLTSVLDDSLDGLPDAIKDVSFQAPQKDGKVVQLICARSKETTVFALTINIGHISFWFIQMVQKDRAVKRLIKVVINAISIDVDLFGKLDSPFDQIYYLWVQQGADSPAKPKSDPAPGSTIPGISKEEYEALKDCLTVQAEVPEVDLLLFKPNKPMDKIAATDTLITAGHHLVVVAKNSTGKVDVVLDYAFGNKKKQDKTTMISRFEDPKKPVAPPEEKGSNAPFKKTLGPLSVENIGLWFKDGKVGITLDATFLLGPVGLGLLGFRLGVPFKFDKPPSPSDITWDLDGLIVSLDRPPLTVAGGFMRQRTDKMDMYAGGLIIDFKPWQFQAMGVYATVTKEDVGGKAVVSLDPFANKMLAFGDSDGDKPKTYTMAFIFVRLNGPLFSVGFADVAGLVAGFGVNSDILLPTVEQVTEFPLISDRSGGGVEKEKPIDTMKRLMSGIWFRPAEGLFWAAAGVRVTAFQMLQVDAVLVLQFGEDVKLGIYGIATLDAPTLVSPFKFAHVELGIVATLDIHKGVFKLEAQLSPRSFVLAPQCHLTGGIAMYSWFKDDVVNNVIAGDWVMSMGGYHQAFRAPTQYPKPPRLGISWSLDTSLSVTGESYFAITPKVCMGGGRLHAALTLGALYAYFDAYADFLINFEPFHFQLQSRIAVGVRFTMDLWIVTIRIAVEIAAELELSGPPFGGVVHVDFWVFGFDVKFGSSPPPPPPLPLREFWNMVLKAGSSQAMGGLSTGGLLTNEENTEERTAAAAAPAFLLTCESGLEPTPEKKPDAESDWLVRAGKFSFLVTFRFAVNVASLKETRDDVVVKDQTVPIPDAQLNMFARPMQVTEKLTSTATVTVASKMQKKTAHTFSRHPGGRRGMLAEMEYAKAEWRVKEVIKPVQQSIWGKYNSNEDPSVMGNRVDSLLDNSNTTIPLVMGLSIAPPKPQLADDKVNQFNVVADRKQPVLSGKVETPRFPDMEPLKEAHLPRDRGSVGWEKVPKVWRGEKLEDSSPPPLNPEDVVKNWASRLGFAQDSMTGARPTELLNRFDTMVPALPMVAVGSV